MSDGHGRKGNARWWILQGGPWSCVHQGGRSCKSGCLSLLAVPRSQPGDGDRFAPCGKGRSPGCALRGAGGSGRRGRRARPRKERAALTLQGHGQQRDSDSFAHVLATRGRQRKPGPGLCCSAAETWRPRSLSLAEGSAERAAPRRSAAQPCASRAGRALPPSNAAPLAPCWQAPRRRTTARVRPRGLRPPRPRPRDAARSTSSRHV